MAKYLDGVKKATKLIKNFPKMFQINCDLKLDTKRKLSFPPQTLRKPRNVGRPSAPQIKPPRGTLWKRYQITFRFSKMIQRAFSCIGDPEIDSDGDERCRPRKETLSTKPLDICLIMSNQIGDDGVERPGSEKDVEALAKTFSSLPFRVLLCKSKTKDEMDQILNRVSELGRLRDQAKPKLQRLLSELQLYNLEEWDPSGEDFTPLMDVPLDGDAFVCCVLSHEQKVLPDEAAYSKFFANKCYAVTCKPKMFIFQVNGKCTDITGHGGGVLAGFPSPLPKDQVFLPPTGSTEDDGTPV